MTELPPGSSGIPGGAAAVSASEIARLVDGTLAGPSDPELTGVAPLEHAGPQQLSFLASPKYLGYLQPARAGAVIVARDLADQVPEDRTRIVVDNVYLALARAIERLHPETEEEPGIHPTAVIGAGARIGDGVTIGPYVVLGRDVELGDRVRIGAHCHVGDRCVLGSEVRLLSNVTLYRRTRIGARSVIHAGVRIGVDGFGYVHDGTEHRRVPQAGDVVIGEDVDIGANTTIDRGSVGSTVIGNGVKIDNLVQVAHNVRIGDQAIIVAQVGIAGSTQIGRRATLAGQAGLGGHLKVGEGATVAAQAGVFGDVPAGEVWSGYPARPHKDALKAQAGLFRLQGLMKRLRALERAVFGNETNVE